MSDHTHSQMDRRPNKRPRLAWDISHTPKAQSGIYYGQEIGNFSSFGHPRLPQDHDNLYVKGLPQRGSPPWRDDDKDGHYIFGLGENLTTRCNYCFFLFNI